MTLKTADRWNEEKYNYDLRTALRGPDLSNLDQALEMKDLVTARLRHIEFPDYSCGGAAYNRVVMSEYEIQLAEQSGKAMVDSIVRMTDPYGAARQVMLDAFRHWMNHLKLGVHATREHTIWGGNGCALYSALERVTFYGSDSFGRRALL